MSQTADEELLGILAEKDRQIAALQARVTQLEARVAELEQLLEKATRAQKRPAASRATRTGARPIAHFPPKNPMRN